MSCLDKRPWAIGPFRRSCIEYISLSQHLQNYALAAWYSARLSREEWLERCADHKFNFLPPAALMNDRNFVLSLIPTNLYYARRHIPPHLQQDKTVAIKLATSGCCDSLTPCQKDDPDVMLAAVNESGHNLRHASSQRQDDPLIVLAAVQQNGLALAYASDRLCGDRNIVRVAVADNRFALQYASPELQNDREMVLTALKANHWKYGRGVVDSGRLLSKLPEALKSDTEIVQAAIENGFVFEKVSDGFERDRQVLLCAVLSLARQ